MTLSVLTHRGPRLAGHMIRPKPGPLCAALEAFLAQANRGETFVYFRGPSIDRVMLSPDNALTKMQRAEITRKRIAERLAAKREGRKAKRQPAPDQFKDIRHDVLALQEKIDHYEIVNLVKARCIVVGGERVYEATVLVQRNGLRGVRERVGVTTGAA